MKGYSTVQKEVMIAHQCKISYRIVIDKRVVEVKIQIVSSDVIKKCYKYQQDY